MEQKKRKTYTQDYGDKGRSAANKFKQGRESIVAWDVPDTVHWHELLVDKKLDLKKLKVWLKENAQTPEEVQMVKQTAQRIAQM